MNLEYITQGYLKYHRRKFSAAWEINYGDCYRWAMLAYKLHGGQLVTATQQIFEEEYFDYCDDTSPAFLFLDGKYYDSEAPVGQDDWHDLEYFTRAETDLANQDFRYQVRRHGSLLSFRKFWKPSKSILKTDEKLYQILLNKRAEIGVKHES